MMTPLVISLTWFFFRYSSYLIGLLIFDYFLGASPLLQILSDYYAGIYPDFLRTKPWLASSLEDRIW